MIYCALNHTLTPLQLRRTEEMLQSERLLRKRQAQGDIFHEDGKVLIRCTKCYEVMRLFVVILL